MNNFYHYYKIVYMYWIDINTFIVNDAFYTFYTCICISGCISAGSVFDIAWFFLNGCLCTRLCHVYITYIMYIYMYASYNWYRNISMINSINDSLITLERTMVPNTCPWRRGKKRTGSGICWTLQCPSSWTNTRRRTSIWWTTPQWAWQV